MSFVLVIMVYVGAMGKDNSNALTSIVGFTSKESCLAAARLTESLETGAKNIKTVCLEVK